MLHVSILSVLLGEHPLSLLKRVIFGMKDTVFKKQSKILPYVCDTEAQEKLIRGMLGTKTLDSVKKPK